MTKPTVKRRRGPPGRHITGATPHVVFQRGASGKFILTPEALAIGGTEVRPGRAAFGNLRSNLELYLQNMKDAREGRAPKYPYVAARVEDFLQLLVNHKKTTINVRLDPPKRRGERRDVSRE